MTTETSELIEVTPLPEEGNIQVGRKITLSEGEEVISQQMHYTLYSSTMKEQFLAEVEGGAAYVAAVDW